MLAEKNISLQQQEQIRFFYIDTDIIVYNYLLEWPCPLLEHVK